MRPRGLLLPAATVLLTAASALAQMPQIGTVSPATATINAGVSQTFTFTGTYSPSAQAGLDVQITYSGIGGGCWFNAAWNSGNPYFMLHDGLTGNDMGTAYFLQGGTASDSLCQVKAQSFTFDGQGNLTMQVGVTFSAAAAGQSFVFLELAVDFATGDNSGWWAQPGDYLNVAAATQGPPQDGTVTPANGSTPPNQNFSLQFTATDPNGWGYSNQVQVLISRTNNPYDYYNSCLVMAAPAQGVAYLGKNDLSSWDVVWFGQGQASNSQCTLIGQGSQVSINGSSLTMTLNLQFSPTYVGTNYIQEYVWDSQFGTAPFATIGTVTVVGAPPIILTTCNNFPLGITGQLYTAALEVQGSSPPYTWFLQSGSLPPGVSLSAGGIFGGVPTQSGNYGFTIGVRDTAGLSAATPLTCGLNIFDPGSLVTQNGGSPDPYMPATQVGVFRSGVNFREDSNGNGIDDESGNGVSFTPPGGHIAGDIPVTGDWNGDGKAEVGVFRPSTGTWWLDINGNGVYDDGDVYNPSDRKLVGYQFGGLQMGGNVDTPIVGDWTGIGKDCIGIYRSNGSFWLLDLNCNGTFESTPTDAFFPFGGLAGDVPVAGKWTGSITKVGVVRKYAPGGIPHGNPFYWVLDAGTPGTVKWNPDPTSEYNHQPDCGGGTQYSSSNHCFAFGGLNGDVYVTGDWYNTGIGAAGVYRAGAWVLDGALPGQPQVDHGNPNTQLFFGYGGIPGDIPITGHWGTATISAPVTLPTGGLHGFTYFPAGHAFPSMLYDWYSQDCLTSSIAADPPAGAGLKSWVGCPNSSTVSANVASELRQLYSNGFNLVHLYVWDQDSLNGAPTDAPLRAPLMSPGFVSFADSYAPNLGGPASSPASQFQAFHDFIGAAYNATNPPGLLKVFVHFATGRVQKELAQMPSGSNGQIAGLGVSYGNWVNQFVNAVSTNYPNAVAVWDFMYGVPQNYPGLLASLYSTVMGNLDKQYSSGRPLIAVDLDLLYAENVYGPVDNFAPNDDIVGHLGGTYVWSWRQPQQEAYTWHSLGVTPDLYTIQAWTASHGDLARAISCVAGTPDSLMCPNAAVGCAGGLCSVSPSQMFITEFGTSSSMEPVNYQNWGTGSPYYYAAVPSFGDAQTPTTTNAGQAQYVTNELCMFGVLGIKSYAYFGLYDAATWWEQRGSSGWGLAWGGYWGLRPENVSAGNKPSWNAMLNPPGCPNNSGLPPYKAYPPVVAVQTDGTTYAVGTVGTMWYTAADVTSLSSNEAPPPPTQGAPDAYSCKPDPPTPDPYRDLGAQYVGSCAFAPFQVTSTSATAVTLMGTNNEGGSQVSGQAPVASIVLAPAPSVTGLTNATTRQSCSFTPGPCNINIGQNDVVEVFGQGFNPLGGNIIELINQANPGNLTWFFLNNPPNPNWNEGSPSNRETTHIFFQMDCSVAPTGQWNLVVRDSPSGTPSAPATINVVQGGTCH